MLQDILNSELEKVSNWLMANELTVNIKTTNYVIFKVCQKQLPSVLFNIRINNETIERRTHAKFLGVYADENLNWKEHVYLIANKVSKSIDIITKARVLPFYGIVAYPIFCLVYPYLQNGIIVLGSTYKTILSRLVVLRKRIIRRVITKSCFDAFSALLFYKRC